MIAAARIGTLLLRHWPSLLGIAVAVSLATLLMIRTEQRDDARAALAREQRAHLLFAARVEARAEEIGRRFAEHARRVERNQQRISQEVDHEYQDRIADVRRRADALRVQLDAARRAHPGGAGGAALPGLPDAAGGADAATGDHGLSLEERVVATEQAIRLDALQRWVRAQAEIPPEQSP